MLVSHDENADQIRDIRIGNRSFENVSQFKYLGTTVQLWRLAANILNKQPRTNDKGWSSSLGVGHGANNPSQ
jgi:hypothetical protein